MPGCSRAVAVLAIMLNCILATNIPMRARSSSACVNAASNTSLVLQLICNPSLDCSAQIPLALL